MNDKPTEPKYAGYGSKEWHEQQKARREAGPTPDEVTTGVAFQGFFLGLLLSLLGVAVAFLLSTKDSERGIRTIGSLIGAAIWFVVVLAIA